MMGSSDVRLNTERIEAEEAAWQACIVDGQTYTSRDREAFASGYRAADVAGSWTTANAAEMGDFAKRIAGYMGQRNTPWADEATMREAVNETVRLLLTEASHETRALLAMPEDAAGSWNDTERLRAAILDIDAHATPLGEDDDGFVTTGYLVSVGSMHRALGLVGHTSERADAAENDTERPREDGWCYENGVRCVACPDCAFTFDAIHTDGVSDNYTCPLCKPESGNGTERLRTALADLRNCAKGYLPTPHSQSQIARVFAAADAALAESVPSPPAATKTTKES